MMNDLGCQRLYYRHDHRVGELTVCLRVADWNTECVGGTHHPGPCRGVSRLGLWFSHMKNPGLVLVAASGGRFRMVERGVLRCP